MKIFEDVTIISYSQEQLKNIKCLVKIQPNGWISFHRAVEYTAVYYRDNTASEHFCKSIVCIIIEMELCNDKIVGYFMH